MILIVGGFLTYAKMTNQTMSDLLPSTLKGMISKVGEGNLSKEDYYTISNIKTTGSYEFTLKNPDNKSLSFNELKNKTKEGGENPLDFNVTILKGGISSDKFYEIRNVSEPKYISIQNGTETINKTYLEVIDLNKTHLNITKPAPDGNISILILKNDIRGWDTT